MNIIETLTDKLYSYIVNNLSISVKSKSEKKLNPSVKKLLLTLLFKLMPKFVK